MNIYTAWNEEEIIILDKKSKKNINLSNEIKLFLFNIGLPKEVASLGL